MKYEFRAQTLHEVVSKATGRCSFKSNDRCDSLQNELERNQEALTQRESRVARLERNIQSLSDQIENDKENLDNDDIARATDIAISLASIIPAVRAVRIGISAIRAGVSAAQAIRNGATISDAVLGVIGGIAGINLLSTPAPRRQMQSLLSELQGEMDNIEQINRSMERIANEMEQGDCNSRNFN